MTTPIPEMPLRVAELDPNGPTPFSIVADAAACAAIARALKIPAVRKLRFEGEITPLGQTDWDLRGHLGATVEQSCVVTLGPVVTRLEDPVRRQFLAEIPEGEADEDGFEMAEDETVEPLGKVIDPAAVMLEALALALPQYPRAKDATPVTTRVAPPGVTPMSDEEIKPFAGLASLRDKLEKKS